MRLCDRYVREVASDPASRGIENIQVEFAAGERIATRGQGLSRCLSATCTAPAQPRSRPGKSTGSSGW